MLRVNKSGALAPADALSASRCREAGYKVGDCVMADLRRPRDAGQWRAAHLLAEMVSANIQAFAGMDAHAIIKGLQLESRLECDEADVITVDGEVVRIIEPRSLSFGSMSQERFAAFWRGLCDHLATNYFSGVDQVELEKMVDMMEDHV